MSNDTAFCFDLDGTITTTEVLPCIASQLGISEEMAVLTRATMDGHIPFESSFRLRCLLLGQIETRVVIDIVREVPLDPHIEEFIVDRPDNSFVVTGNLGIWISPIIERLGCSVYASRGEFMGGLLRVNSILNKGDVVSAIRDLGFSRIVAIGDGANDAPMFQASDVAIAYGGVHAPSESAILHSDYIIYESELLCRVLKTL